MSVRRCEYLPFRPLARFFGTVIIEVRHGIVGDLRYFDRQREWAEVEGHQAILADVIGVHRRTINRWSAEGVPVAAADEAAIALGVHPSAIWPDWFDRVEVAS